MPHDALHVIECAGDPRAMGEAQGHALRASIRACVQGPENRPRGRSPFSLRPFVSGPVLSRGMGREIVRHYPHLSERIQGLARGADLPVASLMGAFVREARSPQSEDSLAAEAAAVVRCEGGQARLSRRLGRRGQRWIVRRSAPQVGFRSVEVTLAWTATAVAGVNEAGVAAALAPHAAADRTSDAPDAALLIQEFLQRFESLPGCIDWALKRPVSGDVAIALADATGAAAVVEIGPTGRTVTRVSEGLTAAGGHAASHAALLASGAPEVDGSRGGAAEPDDGKPSYVVCAEPALRRLRVVALPGGAEELFPVSR